jgi:hypothetical protein
MYAANPDKRTQISNLTLGDKDYLPYSKAKVKIALAMPDCPQIPKFKNYIQISYEYTLHILF